MLTAINLEETKDFSVKGDDGENKTVFVIKVLKNSDKYDLFMGCKPESISKKELIGQLKLGLKEILNVNVGGEVKNITEIDDTIFDMFDLNIVLEVIDAITNFNLPSETERKN
jgi:hypothetical protein